MLDIICSRPTITLHLDLDCGIRMLKAALKLLTSIWIWSVILFRALQWQRMNGSADGIHSEYNPLFNSLTVTYEQNCIAANLATTLQREFSKLEDCGRLFPLGWLPKYWHDPSAWLQPLTVILKGHMC